MKLDKKEILPPVLAILKRRFGELAICSGQGIMKGERVEFVKDGKRVRCVIKASSGGRISFGRRDGKWSGLDDSDFVVVVAPTSGSDETPMVSMFDQQTIKSVFEMNQAAQEKAGMGTLPNWIAPYHEAGRGARGVGDGFGTKAIWNEPLTQPASPLVLPTQNETTSGLTNAIRPLTIAEAKEGLARTFGVKPEAVEITIRG